MDRPKTSKRQFHMHCNTVFFFQCSMFLDNVKLFKNKCHHILDMLPDFFSPCKRIDMCRKFSIILASITRPNSIKNIACSNIWDFPKQIICTQILSYKTVVSSFTLRCKSTRQQFPLQRSRKHALSVFEVNKCRVSQSTVSSWEIPNTSGAKSSARGAPPRERKMRHA